MSHRSKKENATTSFFIINNQSDMKDSNIEIDICPHWNQRLIYPKFCEPTSPRRL